MTSVSGPGKRYKSGDWVEDYCRPCKLERRHTVLVVDEDGVPLRVLCDTCGSQHNYRGGRVPASSRPKGGTTFRSAPTSGAFPAVSERERSFPKMSDLTGATSSEDLELMLRRVIREETGLTPVTPADKWQGGEMVLRPGRDGVQEKTWPIETFFSKVVMLRNRLRVMEQQINTVDLPDATRTKLQGYITACYGSLTSFNVLFADEDDRFRGSGGK
ncbi:MAG: hypothetical protein GY716_13005 [bacterium]|nr:hypothetical protein [bacterium]